MKYIAIKNAWHQCSSDYQSVERTHAMELTAETTVKEIMDWSDKLHTESLGSGELKIVELVELTESGS